MRSFVLQALRFLGVGGVAYVVDTGTFNVLLFLGAEPLAAKTISTGIAIVVSYVGNRWFTFRASEPVTGRAAVLRQLATFLGVNLVAGGLGIACLWSSRTVLGFESVVADNIAANVVGVALGMVVRFVLYRAVVFRASAITTSSRPTTATETPAVAA